MKRYYILIIMTILLGAAASILFLGRSRSEAPKPPLNLLLITLDTMRADRLGCYGDASARTPVLDALAAEGVLFEHCYAPVPLTLPAHCSLLTGRWPLAHGVRNNSSYQLTDDELTLAEKLKQAGYDTAALIAAYVLKGKFGLAQGFDLYDDHLGSKEKAGDLDAQVPADIVYNKFRRWLAQHSGRPFFLWAHFYDPHKPYAPPPAFLQASANDAYRGEVAYVDHHIGLMLADLEARQLLDQTMIVIVGDHGEAFGEHGEKGHGIFCYDESLKVPLIFAGAGLPKNPARIQQRLSLVDIMPTVLELLGSGAAENMQGKSLAAAMAGAVEMPSRPLYLESMYGREMNNWAPLTGLISGNFKYISLPQAELYDLQTDPGEKTNLFFKKNLLARQLDRELAAFVIAHQAKNGPGRRPSMRAEDKAKLAALGYVSSFAAGAADRVGMDPKAGFAYQLRFEELVSALDRGEIVRVETEALRLRDETAAMKLPFAYVMLHYVYERKRQWDKLEANLLQACEIFRESPTQALTFRGFLLEFYYAGGRLDAAERLAREMVGFYPDKTRIMEVLAEISEKREDWPAALQWYALARKNENSNFSLAKKMIKMLIKTGAKGSALSKSEALLRTTAGADDSDLLYSAAMLAIETGNSDRSVTFMRRLLEIRPTAQHWFDFALILGRSGKTEEAIVAMEKAQTFAPNDLDAERRQAAAKVLQSWKARRR